MCANQHFSPHLQGELGTVSQAELFTWAQYVWHSIYGIACMALLLVNWELTGTNHCGVRMSSFLLGKMAQWGEPSATCCCCSTGANRGYRDDTMLVNILL